MGTLFIVATPIGNLADMTYRAVEVLKSVDLIACEDTRVTKKLLDHFEIKTPTISYFQHSKLSKIDYIIEQLFSGKNIALVSDAGTPGISDPGQELIEEIRSCNMSSIDSRNLKQDSGSVSRQRRTSKYGTTASVQDDSNSVTMKQWNNDIKIIPIPGASSLTAAASVSGMIEKEFYFAGFLPKKKGRQTKFKHLSRVEVPIVIYESALRLERTLKDIEQYIGSNIEVFIAREITKMFEEYWGGDVREVITGLKQHTLKGEVALIVKATKSPPKD